MTARCSSPIARSGPAPRGPRRAVKAAADRNAATATSPTARTIGFTRCDHADTWPSPPTTARAPMSCRLHVCQSGSGSGIIDRVTQSRRPSTAAPATTFIAIRPLAASGGRSSGRKGMTA